MASRDEITTVVPRADPFRTALIFYEMGVAVLMLGLGLWQWSILVGLLPPSFEAMPVMLKTATMYLAVADLVAAVGLWMRVAWGRVIFIAAAVSEIALHTVFIATYGGKWGIVGMHAVLLTIYATLAVLARRRPAQTA
jgi:hypothetical protein